MKNKKLKSVLPFMIITVMVMCLFSCKKDPLKEQGYTYDEANNWYVQENEETKTINVNFTQSETDISREYIIDAEISHIVFIGDPFTVYKNFNIKVATRATPLYIELNNFNYMSPIDTVALDASGVIFTQKVYLIANGNSSIYAGAGSNGKNAENYKWNSGYKNPLSGKEGTAGAKGQFAVLVNNAYIAIEKNAIFTLVGGNGGNGGNGGRGGENLDTGAFDRADHGGNGGHGGKGGNGGYAIQVVTSAEKAQTTGNPIALVGGNGGNGGNGSDGGSSCKNELQSSKGGNPGNAGNGGDGGDGGLATQSLSTNVNIQNGKGGIGGLKGSAGYNPSIGYGNGGKNGDEGANFDN